MVDAISAFSLCLLSSNSKDIINKPDVAMLTPLMHAVQNGNYDKAKILLENGADKGYINSNGKNAYDLIISKWRTRTKDEEKKMKLLLDKYNQEN